MPLPTIICVSHLAWEERLFQRPQQLMLQFERLGCSVRYAALTSSRRWMGMAESERRIPFGERGTAFNRPFLPLSGRFPALRDASVGSAAKVAEKALPPAAAVGPRVLWVQHPALAVPARRVRHDALVYDCMDPFGAFAASLPGTAERERALLHDADLVFTGGRSLHAQREGLNPRTHCFPSGIDFEHFASAAMPGDVPAELKALARPVLGYVGAVDERIDWPMVARLCAERPAWSVVFVGPLVGLARCPVDAPNFLHVGGRPYAQLPSWLRGFDVALIPWVVNDLTSFMSPTKTPEYLAAGCPVVSTAIPDVVADYGDCTFVANRPEDFVARCEQALARGRTGPVKPPAARTWEEIAREMLSLIQDRLAGGR